MRDQQDGRRPYRGRRPSARRIRFLELLDAGMRPLEASREVGVNERTGRDWAKGILKSKNRRYTFDGVLVREAPGRPKPPRVRNLIRSAHRLQYVVAYQARTPSALRFYHHDHIANSTQFR